MSQSVLISIKDESQRPLLHVHSSTSQSAERLHAQVLQAMCDARGAVADVSYKAGAPVELSLSLEDVLSAARGETTHLQQFLAPQAGVLVVTAKAHLLPDQPAAGSSVPGRRRSTSEGTSKTDPGYASIQKVVHKLYPKERMSKDNLSGKKLEAKGRGDEWQVMPRVPRGATAALEFTQANPVARLAWTALLLRGQKVTTNRSCPGESTKKLKEALGK